MSASKTPRRIIALVVAGGKGARYEGDVPKQYSLLGGVPVLRRAVQAFTSHPKVDDVWVVHPKGDSEQCIELCDALKVKGFCEGDATRQASVKAGLQTMNAKTHDVVLVHDAARPMVSEQLISRVVLQALEHEAMVLPALPVADTLKITSGQLVLDTVSRERLIAVQTPQAAPYGLLKDVHNSADAQTATDDAMLFEAAGHDVIWVEGEEANRKLTTPQDKMIMESLMSANETRVGMGTDVHQLIDHPAGATIEEQIITLGGLQIPHSQRLKGHSDADVVLHAIVDAMLGAIGEGDIGDHFPPSEIKWRDADSAIFVKHAKELVDNISGEVVNVDVTVMSEKPKIAPYRDAIRQKIANILGIMPARINVKATTTEGLGFTGRGEGVTAQAIVSISMPKEG